MINSLPVFGSIYRLVFKHSYLLLCVWLWIFLWAALTPSGTLHSFGIGNQTFEPCSCSILESGLSFLSPKAHRGEFLITSFKAKRASCHLGWESRAPEAPLSLPQAKFQGFIRASLALWSHWHGATSVGTELLIATVRPIHLHLSPQ